MIKAKNKKSPLEKFGRFRDFLTKAHTFNALILLKLYQKAH